eukprot:RCo015216
MRVGDPPLLSKPSAVIAYTQPDTYTRPKMLREVQGKGRGSYLHFRKSKWRTRTQLYNMRKLGKPNTHSDTRSHAGTDTQVQRNIHANMLIRNALHWPLTREGLHAHDAIYLLRGTPPPCPHTPQLQRLVTAFDTFTAPAPESTPTPEEQSNQFICKKGREHRRPLRGLPRRMTQTQRSSLSKRRWRWARHKSQGRHQMTSQYPHCRSQCRHLIEDSRKKGTPAAILGNGRVGSRGIPGASRAPKLYYKGGEIIHGALAVRCGDQSIGGLGGGAAPPKELRTLRKADGVPHTIGGHHEELHVLLELDGSDLGVGDQQPSCAHVSLQEVIPQAARDGNVSGNQPGHRAQPADLPPGSADTLLLTGPVRAVVLGDGDACSPGRPILDVHHSGIPSVGNVAHPRAQDARQGGGAIAEIL